MAYSYKGNDKDNIHWITKMQRKENFSQCSLYTLPLHKYLPVNATPSLKRIYIYIYETLTEYLKP